MAFLVWGLYHGLFLAAEHWWGDSLDRLWRPVRHAYVVLVVLVGWVFFRADTLDTAFLYLHAMSGIGAVHASPAAAEVLNPEILFILALGIIGSTDKGVRLFTAIAGRCAEGPRAWAWQIGCFGALASLFLLSTMKLASSTYNPFIYFRF